MKKTAKRKAELREQIEALQTEGDQITADVRDGKKKLEGAVRSRLEQITADQDKFRSELEEIREEEDSERLVSRYADNRRFFEESPEPAPASESQDPERGEDIDALAVRTRDWRPNLRALRNAHPLFRDWVTKGEFFRAVYQHATGKETDKRLQAMMEHRAPTGFGESMDNDGGFLVPVQFVAELLQRVYALGQVISRCRLIPMSTNKIVFPAVDETSRANGSRHGGVQAFWEEEGGTITPSKGKFSKVELEANLLTAAAHVTDQLLEDVPALGAWLSLVFTEEMTFKLEDAIWEGSGAGQPLGVQNSGAMITIPAEGGQAAGSIVPENIVNMRARLFARSRANSVFFTNQDVDPALHTLVLEGASSSIPVYLPANGLSGAQFDTLYGRPVVPIEYAETLGTAGDITLADMSQYFLGQRGGIQSATSIHVKFLENEQTFRFRLRADGQPWWKSALTPFKGSATQSPFVRIATRA